MNAVKRRHKIAKWSKKAKEKNITHVYTVCERLVLDLKTHRGPKQKAEERYSIHLVPNEMKNSHTSVRSNRRLSHLL